MMSRRVGPALVGLCMCALGSMVAAAQSGSVAPAPFADALQAYIGSAAPQAPVPAGAEIPSGTHAWIEQPLTLTGLGVGNTVAIKGDTAFFGAYRTNSFRGAVNVLAPFVCNWLCMPSVYETLVASDGAANDNFGSALAFDGTTLLVGASGATVGGRAGQGAVYVFTGSGNQWTQVQKLTAFDGASEDRFGVSVAVSGSDALVGAYGAGIDGEAGRGAAYRYTRGTDGVWTLVQKLTASDGGRFEEFGMAVGISGDTALVGGRSAFQFGYYGVGAVYVYSRQCHAGRCNPRWLETQKLVGSPTSTDMMFGVSIAFDGTTAVVGAPWALAGDEGAPVQRTSGAAYVFTRTDGTWTQRQQLLASDFNRNWQFGTSVGLDGGTVVVGAPGAGWPSFMTGAAYVFDRGTDGTWQEVKKLTASAATANDYFGNGVGISGPFAAIGAPQGPNNSGVGTAYFFHRGCALNCK